MRALRFLTCTGVDDTPSTAKIWRHIAFAIISYKIAVMPDLTYDLMGVYLGAVAGLELGQKFTPAAKARAVTQTIQSVGDMADDQQSQDRRPSSQGPTISN